MPLEFDEKYDSTENWKYVTCKKCIKQKDKIMKYVKETEDRIIHDMGDMAKFFKQQEKENEYY
jgi:hypothetical protein